MNSFNLIEILAETFNIYEPDEETLHAEAFNDTPALVDLLLERTIATNGQGANRDGNFTRFQDTPDTIRTTILDFLSPHSKFDIKRIDLLKINAIEILINITQFAPSISIRAFMLSEE